MQLEQQMPHAKRARCPSAAQPPPKPRMSPLKLSMSQPVCQSDEHLGACLEVCKARMACARLIMVLVSIKFLVSVLQQNVLAAHQVRVVLIGLRAACSQHQHPLLTMQRLQRAERISSCVLAAASHHWLTRCQAAATF